MGIGWGRLSVCKKWLVELWNESFVLFVCVVSLVVGYCYISFELFRLRSPGYQHFLSITFHHIRLQLTREILHHKT